MTDEDLLFITTSPISWEVWVTKGDALAGKVLFHEDCYFFSEENSEAVAVFFEREELVNHILTSLNKDLT